MCGIVSFFSSVRVQPQRLEIATLSLRERGPDDQGLWCESDGTAGLGHRRLAIVDPRGGHQPLSNEDESLWAVVNGELYDYAYLRQGLESRGHVFRTRSDSELVCHLYEEHELDFTHYLRGEFALLLYDRRRQRMLAVRDPFGIKPLVYAQWDGQCWFASKARALFAAGLPAAWDEQAFYQACSTQYTLPHQTGFQGVQQLLPGHMMLVERDRLSLKRLPNRRQVLSPSTDWAGEFRQRLSRAVAERIPPDLPVATQLSGGIDSGCVAALAAQHCPRVCAFTVCFDSPQHDERQLAHSMAVRHGIRGEFLALSTQDLLEALRPAVVAAEGLAVNAHLSAKFLLSRCIQEAGYKVVLTGEGADEVLLGYPHFRLDLAENPAQERQIRESNQIASGIMVTDSEGLSLSRVEDVLGAVPSFLRAKAALGKKIQSCMQPDFLGCFAKLDPFLAMLGPDPARLRSLSRLEQASQLWNQSALSNYILNTLGDGCEMAHSVEGRLPFLDGGLTDWLAEVPLSWKIHQGREKHLLREACRDLLTPELISRQKQPFMAPPLRQHGLLDRLWEASQTPHRFVDAGRLRQNLSQMSQSSQSQQQEWEPALTWVLTSYYLQEGLRL